MADVELAVAPDGPPSLLPSFGEAYCVSRIHFLFFEVGELRHRREPKAGQSPTELGDRAHVQDTSYGAAVFALNLRRLARLSRPPPR
jgi:hypothetical protein